MSGNLPNAPHAPLPSRALSPTALTAIVVGAFLATLTMVAICSGVVYFGYPAARNAVEAAGGTVPNLVQPNVNDWWTQRVLSELYTGAIDKVVAHESVIEKLGEPVEPDINAQELFRRENTGALNGTSETIEFDVIGPRGRGTVNVEASGAGAGPIKVNAITVTLEDGSAIDIKPPPEWNINVR
jgi:hypothetical protein